MTILVIGASSQIGYYTLRRLCGEGYRVLALSRQPFESSGPLLEWRRGGIEELECQSGLEGIVSFGPLIGVAAWLSRHIDAPAGHLVATSSMSALTKQTSASPEERRVVADLIDGEAHVHAQCKRLGMRCTILRPTMVYGAGRDKNLTPIAQRAVRHRVAVLPVGSGSRQPVHADDLAMAAVQLLESAEGVSQTLSVGGGERMDASSMFRKVHAALPVPTLALPVPPPVMRLAATMLVPIRGPVSRLSTDLIADNGAFIDAVGFEPRRFMLSACMLGVGDNWQAKLDAVPLRGMESD